MLVIEAVLRGSHSAEMPSRCWIIGVSGYVMTLVLVRRQVLHSRPLQVSSEGEGEGVVNAPPNLFSSP